jgi:hypothetical protein
MPEAGNLGQVPAISHWLTVTFKPITSFASRQDLQRFTRVSSVLTSSLPLSILKQSKIIVWSDSDDSDNEPLG